MKRFVILSLLYLAGVLLVVGAQTHPTVVYTEGDVRVDGEEVYIGQRVEAGSWIQTGNDGYCEVQFEGPNIIQFQPDTVARISVNAAGRDLDLRTGAVAMVLDRIHTISQNITGGFAVRTPTAVAGVRGTAFFIMVESQTSTYVCTCNGVLEQSTTESGDFVTVEAEHHEAYRFSAEGGDIVRRPAPILYHTDEHMDLLAEKIEVTIPWGTIED